MQLSDEQLLASLKSRQQIIRDRVHGVAAKFHYGLILHGAGGTSKSFTVESKLRELACPYKLSNTRLTAKGLFELLHDDRDTVHVIEDAEPVFKDQHSAGVLRAALWGQKNKKGHRVRLVTWIVNGVKLEFEFEGGIIAIMNQMPPQTEEMQAVCTRVSVEEFSPPDEEIIALMRSLAKQGHRHESYFLDPSDCLETVEEIVARTQRARRRPDLRLMVNAFQDRLQWVNGAAETCHAT